MSEDGDLLHSILACGHAWDGTEPWEDMAVILKEAIDGPEGPLPAYSTGHHGRRCHARLTRERPGSVEEADHWLREMLAAR